MAGIDLDVLRNVLGRQDVVGNRRRPVAVDQMVGRLVAGQSFRNREPAMILQCGGAQRAVAIGSRQQDANRLLGPLFGQRDQEAVDGGSLTGALFGLADRKASVLDRGDHGRRAEIDRTAFDRHRIVDVDETGAVGALNDAAQPCVVQRLGILEDEDDRLVVAQCQLGEKPLDAVDGAGRSPDTDDQRGLGLRFRVPPPFCRLRPSLPLLSLPGPTDSGLCK